MSIIQINVMIMGQFYMLVCQEGEQVVLYYVVVYFDQKMCVICDVGCIKGIDCIVVMVGLGIVVELLSM